MKKLFLFFGILQYIIWTGFLLAQDEQETKFFITSEPIGATIYIGGEVIGKTPSYLPYKISGEYLLRAEKPGYESWSHKIDFSNWPKDTLACALKLKTKTKAFFRSFLLPGWGQRYAEERSKGKILTALQFTSLISLGAAQLYYDNRLENYNNKKLEYETIAKSYTSAPHAWNELNSSYSKLENAHELRQILVYSAIGAYALNLIDILFFFPEDLHEIKIFGLVPDVIYSQANPMVGLSYSF